MINRIIKFGLVGFLAMFTHWIIVLLLVQLGLNPLLANVVGFLGAFPVSYSGHKHWTFKIPNYSIDHRQSLQRFFMVATNSFVLNEFLYFVLLTYTTLNYMLALAMVLIFVSLLTFICSYYWAFR